MDLVKSFSLGFATTYSLKYTMEKTRPNGSDDNSFPSGHTFGAFSGAAYLQTRYGYKVGIPAYILAGVTGYSRINASAHYFDDVIGGASIAILANTFITQKKLNKHSTNVSVFSDGNQMQVNLTKNFAPNEKDHLVSAQSKSNEFGFYIGPTYLHEAEFSFQNNDVFDLFRLKREKSYQHTGNISFKKKYKKWGESYFFFKPYELIIEDRLYKDINLGDKSFHMNENVTINWLQYDFNLEHYFKLTKNDSIFDFRLGAGLYSNFTYLKILSNVSDNFKKKKYIVVPFISTRIGRRLFKNMYSELLVSFFDDGQTKYYKSRMDIDYALDSLWSLIFSYEFFSRQFEFFENSLGETFNESSYRTINFGLKYRF